jgi:predicted acylesterase/phospholipase RssA
MKREPVSSVTAGEFLDNRAECEQQDPPGLDALDQPPVDRYCDVVLTGGVTDGVIYPWALVELARKYRFKNIGGTSVGAMAAALTAAAEYARRRGSVAGFNEVLLKLPRMLGDEVNGDTRLYSLFQPAKSTRRLFELFVGIFTPAATVDGKSQTGALMKKILSAVLCAYWKPALAGALLGLLIGVAGWWWWHFGSEWALIWELLLSALPYALVIATILVAIAIYLDCVHGFVNNGFGICTGFRNETTPPGTQSLVEWLHQGIQGACDKPLEQPLTFRDLWDAPGGPIERPLPPALPKRKSRSIDLRMVTTNLTHGRPYALPVEDETSRLFFRKADLAPYFPPAVLDFLVEHSQPYVSKVKGVDPDPANVPADLRELPAGDLPIVVAARLSLSFPVLFSAVPLWAIDYEAEDFKDRRLRRCWFSDGGICSNFPVHLFDAALPEWPTFGIAIVERSLFWRKQRVYMPQHYNQGRGDRWDRFGDPVLPVTGAIVPPRERLAGFLASVIWSAKDWKDNTSMRMPGVRDRVVRVNLEPGESGLNLKMTSEQILDLARDYGRKAGKALIKKFIGPTEDQRPSQYWNEHRWVRFNSFLVGLRERIENIGAAAERAAYAAPLSTQIAGAARIPPLSEKSQAHEKLLTQAQIDDLRHLLAALKDLESKFAQADLPQPYTPLPTPSLRIRPPL